VDTYFFFITNYYNRGFILKLIEKRWNITIAIFTSSILFGLIHIIAIPNSNTIDILLLLIGGASIGVMLSLITYFSGNIWNSALIHSVWNCLIVGRIIRISSSVSQETTSLFRFKILNENFLWTGGKFGIETSLPAILGYFSVILFMILLKKNKKLKLKT